METPGYPEQATRSRRKPLVFLASILLVLVAVEGVAYFGFSDPKSASTTDKTPTVNNSVQQPSVLGATTDESNNTLLNETAGALHSAINSGDFQTIVNRYMTVSCVIANDASLATSFGLREPSGNDSKAELSVTPEQCVQLLSNEELAQAMQKAAKDQDKDGLNDFAEEVYQTNPNQNDTDQDGYTDFEEVSHGFDPLVKAKT